MNQTPPAYPFTCPRAICVKGLLNGPAAADSRIGTAESYNGTYVHTDTTLDDDGNMMWVHISNEDSDYGKKRYIRFRASHPYGIMNANKGGDWVFTAYDGPGFGTSNNSLYYDQTWILMHGPWSTVGASMISYGGRWYDIKGPDPSVGGVVMCPPVVTISFVTNAAFGVALDSYGVMWTSSKSSVGSQLPIALTNTLQITAGECYEGGAVVGKGGGNFEVRQPMPFEIHAREKHKTIPY